MELDCKEFGMVMNIIKSSKDTSGKSLEMEWTLLPGAEGPPVHIHPEAIETYEIRSGQLEVFNNGKWLTLKAGEKVVVEKGVPHTFKNSTEDSVKIYNTHEPAMEFEGFFKGLHTFAKSGLVTNGKMGFMSLVGLATLWINYSREIVSVKPPFFVMKALAAYGRLRGINFK